MYGQEFRELLCEFGSFQLAVQNLFGERATILGRFASGETVVSAASSLPADPSVQAALERALAGYSLSSDAQSPLTVSLILDEKLLKNFIVEVGEEDETFYAESALFPKDSSIMQRFVKGRDPELTDVVTVTFVRKSDAEAKSYVEVLGFIAGYEPTIEPWLLPYPSNPGAERIVQEATTFWKGHARCVEDWPYREGTERSSL